VSSTASQGSRTKHTTRPFSKYSFLARKSFREAGFLRRIYSLLFILWFLAAAGCGAPFEAGLPGAQAPATGVVQSGLPTSEISNLTPSPKISPEPSPASAQSITISPAPLNDKSPTLQADSPISIEALTPASLPTTRPTTSPAHLRIFEKLWRIVNEHYLYPGFNGLDWEAIHQSYRLRIGYGLTDEAFYQAMKEMIFSLGDEHSIFLSPDDVQAEEAEFYGERDYVGIGVLTSLVPERDRIVILLVYPDSPAERAGLAPHDSILSVDGQPIVGPTGFRQDLLRGPDGSSLKLRVQTPGREPRTVGLVRSEIQSSVPVPYFTILTPQSKHVGYILLTTFTDNKIDDQVKAALRSMTYEGSLDGLILDNRYNIGGADNIARSVLTYFTSGKLGTFVNRQGEEHSLHILGEDIGGSSSVPLAVLIGPGTVSFGEIFAGVLQDSGRAYLIGEPTLGNIELLWGYDFEDGSRAWIAQESFRPRFHPDQDWESLGITPDQFVESEWDLFTKESDPALRAALDYFDGLRDD
jgi:carboxyl-terminal processing protease